MAKKQKSRGWIRWAIIAIIVIVILYILFVIIESQSNAGSVSREVICNNQKDSCDNNCDTKLISYFCKKDCANQWQQCMGYR